MNNLLCLFVLLNCLPSVAQIRHLQPGAKQYLISGHLPKAANCKIFLKESSFYKDINAIDSTTSDLSGRFYFKGTIDEPALYKLEVKGRPIFTDFLLENSEIAISSPDSTNTVLITGSREEVIRQQANQMMMDTKFKQVKQDAETAWQEAIKSKDSTKIHLADLHKAEVEARDINRFKTFIRQHPASFISVNLVAFFLGDTKNWFVADSLLKRFEKSGTQLRQVAYLKKQLHALTALTIGKLAPNFKQQNVNGEWITLESQKGKYVLLDFWASWCAPCRQVNPELVALYKKFQTRNFTVISISLDDNKQRWIKAIQQDQLAWENVSDLKGWNNVVALQYAVMEIPRNFLINPEGKIIALNLHGADLESKLQSVLGK
jgi:peroxiredoxin